MKTPEVKEIRFEAKDFNLNILNLMYRECYLILKALDKAHNHEVACKLIGISDKTLYLKKLNYNIQKRLNPDRKKNVLNNEFIHYINYDPMIQFEVNVLEVKPLSAPRLKSINKKNYIKHGK